MSWVTQRSVCKILYIKKCLALLGNEWVWLRIYFTMQQDSQKPKTFLVTFVGLFLMPSVLSALRNSLSSLSHWRASVSGQDFINDDTKTHHIPLESLLLPLACLAVFEVDHPTTVERYVSCMSIKPLYAYQWFFSTYIVIIRFVL